MSQEIVKKEASLVSSIGNSDVSLAFHQNWNKWLQIATTVYKSGVLNKTWSNPEAVMFGFMKCHELGLSPINGIQDMFLINGKVSMEVHLQNALIHRSGERVEFKITEGDGICTCYMKRKDGMEYTSTFTREDARLAGLWGKGNVNWDKYPKDMLRSRANGIGNRILFSHVLKGLHYSPEELGYATVINHESGEEGITDSPADFVDIFDEASAFERLSKQLREMSDKKWVADVCKNWRDANLEEMMKVSNPKRSILIRQYNGYAKQFGEQYVIKQTINPEQSSSVSPATGDTASTAGVSEEGRASDTTSASGTGGTESKEKLS